MTTLITGATGLIGGHIARALHAKGVPVRILVRARSRREGLRGVAFEEVQGDVRDLSSLRRAMEGVSQVVHAAGVVRLDPFAAERMHEVNVEGTRNVLTAAREARVGRLLHVSTIAAVGAGSLDKPADETTHWNLEDKGPYWTTKHEAEQLVLQAARKGEVDAVVINPAYVLGPGDVKPSSGLPLLLVATGLVVGYPEGGIGFVDVRDVADAAMRALRQGVTGQRYIVCGENLTYRQILTMAAQEVGVNPPVVPLPRWMATGAGRVIDVLGPRFPRTFSSVSSQLLSSLFELSYVSGAKARRELGFNPRPVREAIRDAYRWFYAQGRLPPQVWPPKRTDRAALLTPPVPPPSREEDEREAAQQVQLLH